MKKYDSILERVRYVEYKYGIQYAKPDGKLFAAVRTAYLLFFIYHSVMVLLFLLGQILKYGNTENWAPNAAGFWMVLGAELFSIGGYVLLKTPWKIWGVAVSILQAPLLAVLFGERMTDDLVRFGIRVSFYWRHLIPLVVMFVLLLWMLGIIVRAAVKTNRQYKKIVETLYTQYHVGVTEEGEGISDQQWDEFLANYDPRKDLPKKTKETEE